MSINSIPPGLFIRLDQALKYPTQHVIAGVSAQLYRHFTTLRGYIYYTTIHGGLSQKRPFMRRFWYGSKPVIFPPFCVSQLISKSNSQNSMSLTFLRRY